MKYQQQSSQPEIKFEIQEKSQSQMQKFIEFYKQTEKEIYNIEWQQELYFNIIEKLTEFVTCVKKEHLYDQASIFKTIEALQKQFFQAINQSDANIKKYQITEPITLSEMAKIRINMEE